jgi:hypothetical protein
VRLVAFLSALTGMAILEPIGKAQATADSSDLGYRASDGKQSAGASEGRAPAARTVLDIWDRPLSSRTNDGSSIARRNILSASEHKL